MQLLEPPFRYSSDSRPCSYHTGLKGPRGVGADRRDRRRGGEVVGRTKRKKGEGGGGIIFVKKGGAMLTIENLQ